MKLSKSNTFSFQPFTSQRIGNYLGKREGETKLGETVKTGAAENAEFLILGINEDIGPRANLGNPGSKFAFDAFLGKFLNMQSNRFLHGRNVCILGNIQQETDSDDLEDQRKKVEELDQFIIELLSEVDLSNKRLIVIGGGHNNAYPIAKSFSLQQSTLDIINIDPHADCRPLEGRHSGNPFSTGIMDGSIGNYSVLGLHEGYNSTAILDFLDQHQCFYTFFEDYIDQARNLNEDLKTFISTTRENEFGIEVDLDVIEDMPTSAQTPSGLTISEIRKSVRFLTQHQARYLHLPEGAPTTPQETLKVGKTLAYIVSDFIKKS